MSEMTLEEARRLMEMGFRDTRIDGILYSPWCIPDTPFMKLYDAVPEHSPIQDVGYYSLWLLARQAMHVEGSFVECGVFRGGSASFLADIINGKKALHLYDTFEGMPDTDRAHDTLHVKGDFDDTSLDEVRQTVGHADSVFYHKGRIPETFDSLPKHIAFAHIDVDIYQSVKDCCEHIYPRMTKGGIMVFDDYGHFTCPGANEAVNEYFADKESVPLPLVYGQCVVFK